MSQRVAGDARRGQRRSRRRGEKIGLKVEFESVSAANYINFFIDPKAREGVDGFFTVNYGDYADPAALSATFVLPDGSQNYTGYAERGGHLADGRGARRPTTRRRGRRSSSRRRRASPRSCHGSRSPTPNTVLVTNSEPDRRAGRRSRTCSAPWAGRLGGRTDRADRDGQVPAPPPARCWWATLLVSSFADLLGAVPGTGQPDRRRSPAGGRSRPRRMAVLEQRYHLDEPFLVRYWEWLTGRSPRATSGVSIPLRQDVSAA